MSEVKAGSHEYAGKQYVQYATELAYGTKKVETAVAEIRYGYAAEGVSTGDSTYLTDELDASSLSFASSFAAFAVAFSMMNI